MITIVDYGIGNLGSVANMLKYIGCPNQISSDKNVVANAEKLILPGVGAFSHAMDELEKRDMISPLNKAVVEDKTPVLGICLGMQLLSDGSDEGRAKGLGWIKGHARKFSFAPTEKKRHIPHMGWKELDIPRDGKLFLKGAEAQRFYFVHSYHLVCEDEKDVAATATYGYPFTAAVEKGHIFGAQFHPEKSHRFGMALLENFCKVVRKC